MASGGRLRFSPDVPDEAKEAKDESTTAAAATSKRKQDVSRTQSTMIQLSNANKKVDYSVFDQKRQNSWCSKGVTVGCKDLSYSVISKVQPKNAIQRLVSGEPPKRKTLLSHITLVIQPGEVAYLMGPSGAGKSTLLDVLAARVQSGILSGNVYFNGKPRGEDFFDNSAYVRQDDVHIATLTVDETLRYAARLRVGDDYTDEERDRRVNTVADLLGLETCRHSMVGDEAVRGISGGQKKRLSVAVEIMHMPSLIFLDEPTSGLDSVMSYEVMSFARDLSKQKRTVLATIHQPSIETFGLSSKVVLVKAGRLAYCGPTDEIVAYFSSPRLGYSNAEYPNSADFMLAAVSGQIESSVHGKDADPVMFHDAFKESEYFFSPAVAPDAEKGSTVNRPASFSTPLLKQTETLISRFWLTQSRQHFFILVTILKNIIVAAACGCIFLGLGKTPENLKGFDFKSSFSVASLWYFAVVYTIISVVQIIPQLFFYRVLYTRERMANMYSTFAYWATHAVINLPLLAVAHVCFLEVAYWLVGFPADAGVHFFIMFVTFLNHMIAVYTSQYIASVAPNAEVALTAFVLAFILLISFTGFTIPLQLIPIGWQWASYLTYPRWAYQAVAICIFSIRPDFQPVMEYFGFWGWNKWTSVPILVAYVAAANLIVYWGLLLPKSKLVIEDSPEEAPRAVKPEAVAVTVEAAAPATLNVKDFKGKSVNKIPPTPGLSLVFKDLEYSVGKDQRSAKKLLKGVSGDIQPGEMCALMGGSGAGKSTLLDILAFRKTGGFITGQFYIGGQATRPATKWNSYVTQDNVHIECFTVRETLQFAAHLRLPEDVPNGKRMKRAEDVMTMLGLDHVGDVLVGGPTVKGISGGQARRLTIGVEIMQLPDVIFLDEPTTGLDATIAFEVMSSVRAIADHNRTIVCTIHSPAEPVFYLFDKLLLLALGRQTYFGTTRDAAEYFQQPVFGWKMPLGKNPADYCMEGSQGLLGDDNSKKTIRELNEVFLDSQNYKEVEASVKTIVRTLPGGEEASAYGAAPSGTTCVDIKTMVLGDSYPRNSFSLVFILAARQLYKAYKLRSKAVVALLEAAVVALFHGTLYYQIAPNALISRLSLLFFAMQFSLLANQTFIPEIFADRLLFYRERGAKVYGSFAYWISSSAPFLPQTLASSFIYGSILYHLSGLNSGAAPFWFFIAIILQCAVIGLFFCQALSFLVPTSAISISVFPAALFVLVSFCGFVVPIPALPSWLRWGATAAFPRWAYQALFLNEFVNNHRAMIGPLTPEQMALLPDKTMEYVPYGLVVYAGTQYETNVYDIAFKTLLETFGFDTYTKWHSVPILFWNMIAFFCACYIPIRFVSFERR